MKTDIQSEGRIIVQIELSVIECLHWPNDGNPTATIPTNANVGSMMLCYLVGKQYRKMEPKYLECGHCQSVLHPLEILNILLLKINSVETVAPFNVVSLLQCCEPRK